MSEMFKEVDEFEIRDELREKRGNIKTFDELVAFLSDVEKNYNVGYSVAPRAMAQAALAVDGYLASKFGITGFQAGCVMWDFIIDWLYSNNKCGLKIVNFDDMLYPQYADRFHKTINIDTWHSLQKQAKKNLENTEHCHPHVIEHWQSIVDGKVPFGYIVVDD